MPDSSYDSALPSTKNLSQIFNPKWDVNEDANVTPMAFSVQASYLVK